MENASKALIMAASVLIGIMIISIGVALFTSFSEFGKSTVEKMEASKIAEWNNTYLKYYGTITTENKNGEITKEPILVIAHDIISVVNHAFENNLKYELQNMNKYDEKFYYVQVDIDKHQNVEKWDETQKNDFLKNNSLTQENETKYYTCTDIKISPVTKKVMYIKFETKKI